MKGRNARSRKAEGQKVRKSKNIKVKGRIAGKQKIERHKFEKQ